MAPAEHHNALHHSVDLILLSIFGFTTAGDWDCGSSVEHLPALHYSVYFIALSFRIMDSIVEL